MKNTLFALTNSIIKTKNIENVNSLESTKLVSMELHKILKDEEVYLYGKECKICGVVPSGLDILVYIKDNKNRIINYRNINDIKLKN